MVRLLLVIAEVLALLLIAVGVGLIYLPAGFIVAGALAVFALERVTAQKGG